LPKKCTEAHEQKDVETGEPLSVRRYRKGFRSNQRGELRRGERIGKHIQLARKSKQETKRAYCGGIGNTDLIITDCAGWKGLRNQSDKLVW